MHDLPDKRNYHEKFLQTAVYHKSHKDSQQHKDGQPLIQKHVPDTVSQAQSNETVFCGFNIRNFT